MNEQAIPESGLPLLVDRAGSSFRETSAEKPMAASVLRDSEVIIVVNLQGRRGQTAPLWHSDAVKGKRT